MHLTSVSNHPEIHTCHYGEPHRSARRHWQPTLRYITDLLAKSSNDGTPLFPDLTRSYQPRGRVNVTLASLCHSDYMYTCHLPGSLLSAPPALHRISLIDCCLTRFTDRPPQNDMLLRFLRHIRMRIKRTPDEHPPNTKLAVDFRSVGTHAAAPHYPSSTFVSYSPANRALPPALHP